MQNAQSNSVTVIKRKQRERERETEACCTVQGWTAEPIFGFSARLNNLSSSSVFSAFRNMTLPDSVRA